MNALFNRGGLLIFLSVLVLSVWTIVQWTSSGVSVQHIKNSPSRSFSIQDNPTQYYIDFVEPVGMAVISIAIVLWFLYAIFVIEPREKISGPGSDPTLRSIALRLGLVKEKE